MVAALAAGPVFAQKETAGFPEDWSHHHVVFSNPGTFDKAIRSGSFDGWYKTVNDPRFTFQQLRRAAHHNNGKPKRERQDATLQRDWSATLGGAGVAPGMYPAKYQFINGPGTPNCSDYVVFSVNKGGVSGSQPNIVGYTNLYVNAAGTGFCPGNAPKVLFSYFVGNGTLRTSPVLGPLSGQVAYVGSQFHVLKGAGTGGSNGTIAAPVAPGAGNTASDTSLLLSGSVGITRSSPFYDYANDVAYVGDDSGQLHKITPVFNGTPKEVISSSGANIWPAVVSTQSSKILTSPIFDGGTHVYVGDSSGYLYSVNSTTGSGTGGVTASGQLGSGVGIGIVDPPILDGTAKSLYVFVSQSIASPTHGAVVVFNISSGLTAGSTGTSANLGTNSGTLPLYAGDFDNTYYSSSNGAEPAGNLYACGNVGGNPTLYVVPITYSSGPLLGTVVTGPVLASGTVGCAPFTDYFNTSTSQDWLFGSVPGNSCGATGGTTAGGCVMSFNITTALTNTTPGPWTPSTLYATNAEIVDTSGRIQKCTGGGCGGTVSTSGTSAPAWTATTTTDGINAAATSTLTLSANGAVSGATVTIGSVTLMASAPVKATGTVTVDSTLASTDTVQIGSLTYSFASAGTPVLSSTHWVYRSSTSNCSSGCTAASTTQIAANLEAAINLDPTKCATTTGGTCYFTGTGGVTANTTVVATAQATTRISLSAITPGTSGNSITMACTAGTGTFSFNGGAACASTATTSFTGGTNGSNGAPNFQYWSGSAAVTATQLAANIVAAITAAEETTAGITAPTYTSGNAFFTITAASTGEAGNSITVGGTLASATWSPSSTHLAGGTSALTWSSQGAATATSSTTVPEPTGASGIIIDNSGSAAGEANIYFGTLSGTGAQNAAIKMTQSLLQ
jgi:hypothetical protein